MAKNLRAKKRGKRKKAVLIPRAALLFLSLILPAGFSEKLLFSASTEAPIPAAPALPSDAPENRQDAGSITLDFKEADINTVLRVMSLKSNVNIVAGPEVHGTVTIRLENVPWQKALEVVLRTYGYVYERDGNIIRVTTRDNMAAEPVITQTFVLNYTKAAEIQNAVQDILTERGRVKVAERTNAIVLTDIPTNLYTISEIIKKLDQITPQAFIDSKIVNTSLGVSENLGIEWKTGGTSNDLGSVSGSSRPVTFPFVTNTNHEQENLIPFIRQFLPVITSTTTANTEDPRSFPRPAAAVSGNTFAYGALNFSSFSAVLQMLKSRANTKVVSNPRIVVLNNQTAEIHVGDNIPLPKFETNQTTGRLVVSGFDYDVLKTGVTMQVTPHINSQEEILVDLQPAVNARGATITFNTDLSAPIISETTAKTQVLIRSGETIAIGGLLTDSVQVNESKVPGLANVPVFGKLFRSKRQTAGSGNAKVETLFFVTVSMVDTEGQPTGGRSRTKQKTSQQQSGDEDAASQASSDQPPVEKVEENQSPQIVKTNAETPTPDSQTRQTPAGFAQGPAAQ